jgi:hypothetical protein
MTPRKMLLALALLPSLFGCTSDPVTTPQEQARIDVLDKTIEQDTDRLKAFEDEAKDLGALLTDDDPTNNEAAIARLENIESEYEVIIERVETNLAERGKILGEAVARGTAPIEGAATLLPPPWNFLAGGLIPLVAGLFFKRSRSHIADMAKTLIRGKGVEAVRYLLKAYGLKGTEKPDSAAPAAATTLNKTNSNAPPALPV